MIDVSNMFENSNFEEIYFGAEYNVEQNLPKIIENFNESSERNSSTRYRYLDENSENITQETIEYFEEEEDSENKNRKEYFETKKIESASFIFMNCSNLKKIQFPPSFNVGKKAKGMFKGCSKLEEVNITLISSNEIEEMESMFEDCYSLKEISFSNDFLTGEIKSLNNTFKNTNLTTLDISYLRLYSLESCSNILDGASIKGTLKIGKYYSNDNIRDNLFKEIAKVTDLNTEVFTPNGTAINTIFENIYSSENHVNITVKIIDIDYNIHYKEDGKYKLYSNYLYIGLGWNYNQNNRNDLDSSVLTFDYKINNLAKVNNQNFKAYEGNIILNGEDAQGKEEKMKKLEYYYKIFLLKFKYLLSS